MPTCFAPIPKVMDCCRIQPLRDAIHADSARCPLEYLYDSLHGFLSRLEHLLVFSQRNPGGHTTRKFLVVEVLSLSFPCARQPLRFLFAFLMGEVKPHYHFPEGTKVAQAVFCIFS